MSSSDSTHPVFKKAREEKWPNNKPEYYGNFIEKVLGGEINVNIATDHISIKNPEGWDRRVNSQVIEIQSEEKAKAFLAAICSIDEDALHTLKNVEFSFLPS